MICAAVVVFLVFRVSWKQSRWEPVASSWYGADGGVGARPPLPSGQAGSQAELRLRPPPVELPDLKTTSLGAHDPYTQPTSTPAPAPAFSPTPTARLSMDLKLPENGIPPAIETPQTPLDRYPRSPCCQRGSYIQGRRGGCPPHHEAARGHARVLSIHHQHHSLAETCRELPGARGEYCAVADRPTQAHSSRTA